jgi:hypothetical protein
VLCACAVTPMLKVATAKAMPENLRMLLFKLTPSMISLIDRTFQPLTEATIVWTEQVQGCRHPRGDPVGQTASSLRKLLCWRRYADPCQATIGA